MKLDDSRVRPTVAFSTLKPGDCFWFLNEVYMKTLPRATNEGATPINSVRLDTGQLSTWSADTRVTPQQVTGVLA